jgi:hypothetical protein
LDKWDVQLAGLLKDRENRPMPSTVIGMVVSGLPSITVSIGEEILLDADQIVVANRLYHLPVPLASGDSVILVPGAGGQIYYAIDKVGE